VQMIYFELDFHDRDARSSSGGGWTSLKQRPVEQSGYLHMTPNCVAPEALEWHITQMQAELAKLRKEVHRKTAEAARKPMAPSFPDRPSAKE